MLQALHYTELLGDQIRDLVVPKVKDLHLIELLEDGRVDILDVVLRKIEIAQICDVVDKLSVDSADRVAGQREHSETRHVLKIVFAELLYLNTCLHSGSGV